MLGRSKVRPLWCPPSPLLDLFGGCPRRFAAQALGFCPALRLSGAWPVQRSAPILGNYGVLPLRHSSIPALSLSSARDLLRLTFIFAPKSTHAPRHSSRRVALNRSASYQALSRLGTRLWVRVANKVYSASATPLQASAQPLWDAKLRCSLSLFACFVSMYGQCVFVLCAGHFWRSATLALSRPWLSALPGDCPLWRSPAINPSAQSALVFGARMLWLPGTLQLTQGDPPLKCSTSGLGQDTLALQARPLRS
jgi:hypothetical protein